MKTTASSVVGKVLPERSAMVPLLISAWEEGTFVVPVGEVAADRLRWEVPDWENIEAVGAADDPARFKIGFQTAETSGPSLKSHL
jgi:hypothetical protein